MDSSENIIKQLTFENYIWVIYIIISLFSIFGDELIKKSIIDQDDYANELARTIFFIILIVSLVVYIYFLVRNYNDFKNNPNSSAYRVRFLGSVLVYIGTICFLYFFIKTSYVTESLSNL